MWDRLLSNALPPLLLALSITGRAVALDCGELPRVDDERLRGEIDVQGNLLSKRIGSAEFKTSLDRTRTDIFSKYPNADQTRLNERLFIYLCQSLAADKTLTESQKREELLRLRRQIDTPPRVETQPTFFVGHWLIVDPRTNQPFSTVELGLNGQFKGSSFGRNLGGPNGIGANFYRFENGVLKFVYIQGGRARVDEMLVGSVTAVSDNEFTFKVIGGYYGGGGNFSQEWVFRRA